MVALGSARVHAEEPHELRYNLRADIPITAVAIAAWVTSQGLAGKLAPEACRLCGDNPLDRRTRSALLWDDTQPAHRTSNWLAFGLLPVGALSTLALMAAHANKPNNLWIDGLIVAESVALASDLNQLVKFSVGRQRPFVHARNQDVLQHSPRRSDDNVSFYSGHTNLAFSLVAASGTVAMLRGYRAAPWIWGVGMPLAGLVGYFRIAADRHYLTDVLTGALLGTGVGVLVPWLFHGRRRSTPDSVGMGRTPLSLNFTWVR
jgi:membrane-associated phospholipid phosphatase